VFCFCWGLGGSLDDASSYKFDNFITNLFDYDLPKGSIYDNYLSFSKHSGDYIMWDKIMTPFAYDPTAAFFDIVVPTKDTTRYSKILKIQLAL
jgi:dynein heavy chain